MKRKVRVLHLRVVTGRGGGPEKTVLLSAGAIDTRRFEMSIAYFRNEDDPSYDVAERAARLGVRFYDVKERCPYSPGLLVHTAAIIRRERVDILHAHDYKSDVVGLLLRPLCGVRLVTTVHGWVRRSAKERLYVRLDQRAIRLYPRVIAVSHQMAHVLTRLGLSSRQVRVVHNAIDPDVFRPDGANGKVRRELGLGESVCVVGAVGRLSPEKDLGTLLRAAAAAEPVVGPIHLVLVGDGPQRDELQRMAREMKRENRTHFLGHRSDVRGVYGALDVLALTSLTEGLPNAVLEAQAMHVPVLATDVGGVRELVLHGETGMLARAGDVQGIATHLVELVQDRARATAMADQARTRIEREFSFAARMRKVERVYDELMGERGQG